MNLIKKYSTRNKSVMQKMVSKTFNRYHLLAQDADCLCPAARVKDTATKKAIHKMILPNQFADPSSSYQKPMPQFLDFSQVVTSWALGEYTFYIGSTISPPRPFCQSSLLYLSTAFFSVVSIG